MTREDSEKSKLLLNTTKTFPNKVSRKSSNASPVTRLAQARAMEKNLEKVIRPMTPRSTPNVILEKGDVPVIRMGKKIDGSFTLISAILRKGNKLRIIVQAHKRSLCSEIECDIEDNIEVIITEDKDELKYFANKIISLIEYDPGSGKVILGREAPVTWVSK